MQFSFKITQCLPYDKQYFVILNGLTLSQKIKSYKSDQLKNISQIITVMGKASAKAQNLKQIITTFQKFTGSDNRIYMKISENKVLGLLRVGEKNLFYRDYIGNIKEIKPTCVLDFYVHQSCQRSGIGKQIFSKFLHQQKKQPSKLAYDRPSQKLLGFLKKHFNLINYIPQNNNYVIYNQYFEANKNDLITAYKEPIQKQVKQSKVQLNSTMDKINSIKKKENDFKNFEYDSIQQLKKQINALTISNGTKKPPVNYQLNCPWIDSKPQKINFRTTSNAYGSHYK